MRVFVSTGAYVTVGVGRPATARKDWNKLLRIAATSLSPPGVISTHYARLGRGRLREISRRWDDLKYRNYSVLPVLLHRAVASLRCCSIWTPPAKLEMQLFQSDARPFRIGYPSRDKMSACDWLKRYKSTTNPQHLDVSRCCGFIVDASICWQFVVDLLICCSVASLWICCTACCTINPQQIAQVECKFIADSQPIWPLCFYNLKTFWQHIILRNPAKRQIDWLTDGIDWEFEFY